MMPDSPSCEFQDRLTAFLPTMRGWAMGLTKNRAAAEDLVQDVAMKALGASESFIPGTNFSCMGPPDNDQSLHFRRAKSA
jgi:DNA-directed RNA polymerase specialized sigma24 family protein